MGDKHNHKKIKAPEIDRGDRVRAPDMVEMQLLDHPVFCLRHAHKDYGVKRCSDDQKISLIHRIEDLCKLKWSEIRASHRHAFGAEKIPISSLNVKPPPFITGDVKFLLAYRFSGKHPMLVHQSKFVLHIIFLDTDFTVYNH